MMTCNATSLVLRLSLAVVPGGLAAAAPTQTLLGPLDAFPPAFQRSAAALPSADAASMDSPEFRPGLGMAITSAGRFGFSKGDGLLGCTYPDFGTIQKAHLAGNPRNLNKLRWAVSFDPPQAERNSPAIDPIWGAVTPPDDININWVAVTWRTEFTATGDYFGRKKGSRFAVGVTYNIIHPGVLIETQERALQLNLERTPGYNGIILPLETGVTHRTLQPGVPVYRANTDGKLADNWILLSGSRAYPDVPLLVVLQSNPTELVPEFKEGKLTSLTLPFEKEVGYAILAEPFGMEGFSPAQTADPGFVRDAVRRSRFWSKALLDYAVDCKESFRVDPERGVVTIHQAFEHRHLQNAWGFESIPLAPYPPVLGVAATACSSVHLLDEVTDLAFPTLYGPLQAVVGGTESSYELPIPPAGTRIPLPWAKGSQTAQEVREKHSIARHDGSRPLPRTLFPGYWTRPDRNIVDAGNMISEWALIWPYMEQDSIEALKANARDYLIDCLDDQELFRQTELGQSIMLTPEIGENLVRPIWFKRTEPYTGSTYYVSYSIPPLRSQGVSLTHATRPLTDLEWGNGLGLYRIYQLAQLSDSWDVVKRNWNLVKGIEGLFEVLQDWACMSASGCESGARWTDTSCYPGYIGFRKLAQKVGDESAWQQGVYLHAKHAAMRLAMFNLGTWVNGFYDAKPWKVQHSMVERPEQFEIPTLVESRRIGRQTFIPDDLRGEDVVIQKWSYYSLVAEGVGYESPDLFYRLMPRQTSEFHALYKKLYPEWNSEAFCAELNRRHGSTGGITAYELMLFEVRDPAVDTATVRRHFQKVATQDLVRRFLKVFYQRNNACHEYLHALVETRDDPVWLEDWSKADLVAASFDQLGKCALFRMLSRGPCEIELGGLKPTRVELDGHPIAHRQGKVGTGWTYERERLMLHLPHGGELRVQY